MNDVISNLLDRDFEGYELRSLINKKNLYYDKYEARAARERKKKKRTQSEMHDAARTVTETVTEIQKLRAKMAFHGILQKQLAEVIGINYSEMSRWLNTPSLFFKHQEVIEQALEIILEERAKNAD